MIDWIPILIVATILAIIIEIIHFAVDMYIIKHIKTKDNLMSKIKIISSFIITLVIISAIFSGFYTTSTNEHTVLTKINGKRIIIKDTGFHFSFLSTRQTIDLREQFMTFPANERFDDSDIILTKDKIPIRISAVFSYKVIDSETWAIKIRNPEEQLFLQLTSIIIETIQEKTYNEIINRNQVEQEIFNKINQKAIEKLSFKFVKTADTLDVVDAKTKAEANEIRTKSLIKQSESEAQSNKLLQESLKDFTPQQIEYLKTKLLANNPNLKWAIPYGTNLNINSE
ncbi:MAG: hypothetical protein KKF56_05430 [Nanoarchaeota archaeon]|nr:hypothetical protein [Nanoarchaeota archaeon]